MTRNLRPFIAVVLTAAALAPSEAAAQQVTARFAPAAAADAPATAPSAGRGLITVAKWGTLAGSAGLAVVGFLANAAADDDYDALERTCVDTPSRCASRTPEGAYTDADLEARYQDVLDADRRARAALLVSQVSLAASVLLFILDLQEAESPPNIPYVPPAVRVEPDGNRLKVGVRLPTR